MKDFLETGTYALASGLILIAIYVLYQRLLKAVGKGKYESFYLELISHKIDWEAKELILIIETFQEERVKIQVVNAKNEPVISVCDEEFPVGEKVITIPIEKLPIGQYKTVISCKTQSISRYFKVK